MSNYSTVSDDELLVRLGSGDEAAFTEIYHRYWEKLLATGFFFTHDKQAAEDIVHEVLISLWSRRAALQISSLAAYLGTAVKFSVFRAIARDRRRRDLASRLVNSEMEDDLEEKLHAKFLEEHVNGIIEQLPEKARLVFCYHRNEELTISEVSGRMGLSPKAAEYHMTKALRALRQAVNKIKILFV